MQQSHSDNSHQNLSAVKQPWGAAVTLPTVLALWCCLGVLQQKASDIPPVETLLITVLTVLVGVWTVQGIIWFVIRNHTRACLLTLLAVSFVGLHGPVSAIFTVGHRTLDKSLFFLVWSAVHTLLLVGLFALPRKKLVAQRVVSATVIALTFMVCLQTFNIALPLIGDSYRVKDLDHLVDHKSPVDPAAPLVAANSSTPDIYYLIVDAYGREDVLNEIYGFDNSDFIQSLESRGFFVGNESRSNYNRTEYSLASSLNMKHLHEFNLPAHLTRMPLRHLIRNSAVSKVLKSSGYRTYAIETGKSETECDNFDHYVSFGKALNDYQDVLYHSTPLPRLLAWTGLVRSAARRHGDRVMFTFDQVPTLAAQSNEPAFVFCHVLAPHPPFLFDAAGEEVEFRGHYLLSDCRNFTACYNYDMDVYRSQYREQVAHLNSKLVEMIDRIQSSNRPSVIILQADHGPRLGMGFKRDGDAKCEWRYRESFSILNAISMPDDRDHEFYPSITPVNTFRLVFNELFGTRLPTVPDDSFAAKRYTFTNVTKEAMPLEPTTTGLASNAQNIPMTSGRNLADTQQTSN